MSPALPLLPILLALACGGCTDAPEAEARAIVFAAASLAAPFQAAAEAFEDRHPGSRIELHFAGTSRLVFQIREGAPADVFASADERSMRRVAEAGLCATPPRVFARNVLTLVTPEGNPKRIQGLADLARDDLTVLLCGPEVPAGHYARRALSRASIPARSASDEPSVKAVLSKIRLGEADAGIVYATDALGAREHVDSIPIPEEHNVHATYPIAVLESGGRRVTAEAFTAFILSATGREILASFGFLAP